MRWAFTFAAVLIEIASCGGGAGSTGHAPVGTFASKPGTTGFYFEDPHHAGSASRLVLEEISWGRLVDVHSVDEHGETLSDPVLRDYIVNENVQTDSGRFLLETSPFTQKARLVVRRVRGAPDRGDGSFESLLQVAAQGLSPILRKSDLPGETPPFSFVARNATLMLRFDDLLADDPEAVLDLSQTVRVLTGYPPQLPFEARLIFDPNHGGVVAGRFHSTRILVDFTVSEAEAGDAPQPITPNSLGLRASEPANPRASVALRLPSRVDPGSGQFALLRNLAGGPLDAEGSRPFDAASSTRDVVRALRAGNERDLNNGFLLDLEPPRIAGSWPCLIVGARPVSASGFDWSLDLSFSSACRKTPSPGDTVVVGENLLEVAEIGRAPDAQGRVDAVRVRVSNGTAPRNAASLLGASSYLSIYRPGLEVDLGCWLQFSPPARVSPTTDVAPLAHTSLRFSEPMDPASVRPFDTLLHVRGVRSTAPSPSNLVVGEIRPSIDLREFTFIPALPFAHGGEGAFYCVRLQGAGGITDVAGNELADELPEIEFSIDPRAASEGNGGVVLRFDSPDELEPLGAPDLRGQFIYDLGRGLVRPRAVSFGSQTMDSSNPVPSIMTPTSRGVWTPLSPLGSRLQTVWRYADLGWSVRDETKYNLDVVGLAWSPANGVISSDFFERFEIRLGHSSRLPDEATDQGLPKHPDSGLLSAPRPFAANFLEDPRGGPKVMNARSAGYRIDPRDLFFSESGTPLLPFPINRAGTNTGGELVSYTWRDTALLARGGIGGAGVPMDIEVGAPLYLEDRVGAVARAGAVPSVGLPLLMEYRCYPSSAAIGLNSAAILLATNTSSLPNFRAFSTGGFNAAGQRVLKDPDREAVPSGAFNPGSQPPGRPTPPADNGIYIGNLDFVLRVSRAHTIWIDTHSSSPRFAAAVLEPSPEMLPPGTRIEVDFRGADGFPGSDGQPFDAAALDAYGELSRATVLFHGDDSTWKSDVSQLDGARYFQMRFTFLNNVQAGLSPELSAVGVAFALH